jgi:hypothetical protein
VNHMDLRSVLWNRIPNHRIDALELCHDRTPLVRAQGRRAPSEPIRKPPRVGTEPAGPTPGVVTAPAGPTQS